MSEKEKMNESLKVNEIEALQIELENVKKNLEEATQRNNYLENICKEQDERYSRLFGLFANIVDYVVTGQKRGN